VAKPLDAMKSTSFFERVDNIELSGAPKGALPSGITSIVAECDSASTKPKAKSSKPKEANGKQATLFGMKKGMPPPRAITRESFESTETEEGSDDTLRDDIPPGVLEESQVNRTSCVCAAS